MPRKRKSNEEAGSSNGLSEALLGLLAIKPMSGYDVTRSYTHALQQIWYAPQGQVYPTLRKMHASGLLRVQVEVQKSRPNRKVYSLTAKGLRTLVGWLTHPAMLPRMHHEFIHKLFLLNHLELEKQMEFVETYVARSKAWAAELKRIEQKLRASLGGVYGQSARFQHLALQHLIRLVECEAKSAQQIAIDLQKQSRSDKSKFARKSRASSSSAFGGLSLSPGPIAAGKRQAEIDRPVQKRSLN
jgi:DNA-binding PadR family transcriptional regulator